MKDSDQHIEKSEALHKAVNRIMNQQTAEAQALRAKCERLMKRVNEMSPEDLSRIIGRPVPMREIPKGS